MKFTLLSLALLAGLAVTASADQLTFNTELDSNPFTGKITYTVGSDTDQTGDAYIDVLKFNTNSGSINTVCVDLADDIYGGSQGNYAPSTIGGGSSNLDLAARIAYHGMPSVVGSPSNIGGAALQLAVWYAEYYGTSGFALSQVSGHSNEYFTSDNKFGVTWTNGTASNWSTIVSDANAFYNAGTSGTATLYTWDHAAGTHGQDQLTVNAAPEPLTMVGLAVGVAGAIKKRKSK